MVRKYPALVKRGYATIEQEAAKIRQMLGVGVDDKLPGEELLDRLSGMEVRLGTGSVRVDWGIEELGEGVEAESRIDRHEKTALLLLPSQTYEMLERGHPRARFTVPHEIFHIFEHTEELYALSRMTPPKAALLRGDYSDLRPFEDAEWQANAGAASLLMPAAALERLASSGIELTAEEIAQRFGVSAQCAEIRLRVFSARRRELRQAVNAKGR